MTAIPRLKPYSGWPLLTVGFRPFFLLGAIYAGVEVLVWLPMFNGELSLMTSLIPRDWHVHEMLYGYVPAVITGFLFTAIPNWTGRMPIQGKPLLFLVIVWLAGRLCVTLSADIGWFVAMTVDSSFLMLVVCFISREILAGRNWRNLNVVAMVTLLLVGNVAFHLEAHYHGAADFSIRIGIAVVILLITMIGGRIIPSFTRNWLARENPGRLPTTFGRFDIFVVAVTAVTLAIWVAARDQSVVCVAMAFAGILHIVRLGRWAGDRTLRERLVLILHLGYSFVPLGFLLLAASGFGLLSASAGIHAWTVGAAGTMTLAVMTRATLGHTGQRLTARLPTQLIYGAVIVAALSRICAAVEPSGNDMLLHVAAFAWAGAFLGFGLCFGRLLLCVKK